jgi:hypothetical protein
MIAKNFGVNAVGQYGFIAVIKTQNFSIISQISGGITSLFWEIMDEEGHLHSGQKNIKDRGSKTF